VVEAAIVLLTFFMLVFGVFEAGRFLNTEQVLTNAAREGARLAVTPLSQTNTLPTQAEITAHVNQFLAAANITGATVSAPTQVSVSTGLVTTTYTQITVSKNYQVLSVPNFFNMLNVTLSGCEMRRVTEPGMRRERIREKGAAAVEMAIVLPLLAMLLLGTMELGDAARDHQVLQNAAREGARFSALPTNQIAGNPNGAAVLTTIRNRVIAYLNNEGITTVAPAQVSVNQAFPMTIGTLTVQGSEITVTYSRPLIFPGIASFIPLGTLQLQGRAVFRNFH
jgi:Flp pilus assembly protein TadG